MNRIIVALAALSLAACAVRIGGPSPGDYNAVAVAANGNASAAQVADQLNAARADVVLLAANRDSSWFEAVASQARLDASRTGVLDGRGYAFLSRLELIGDTTLALAVPEGGTVNMHDALYRVDQHRYINTMTVRVDAPDLRAAVRSLMSYIADDVMGHASVLIAVDGPTAAAADSIAMLMRATFTTAAECGAADLPADMPLRLLYGPVARMTCRAAQSLQGEAPAIHARVVVTR
jgi:hypothetical protein